MRQLFCFLTVALLCSACGQSYEEKRRIVHKQRMQLLREDSAAFKIAVLPTLDCLPLFVAKANHLFSDSVDVRLKMFTAQMDCDTALAGGSVQGSVSDLVRTERLIRLGTPLRYVTSTGLYWQLYTNRMARIRELKQLDDKMLSMTRYSTTDMLVDMVVDSAKLKTERVFKIQVNDVFIRLKMLLNNEIDAVLLPEPQASQARQAHHHLLLDSRKMDMRMGVIAVREKDLGDKNRQKQLAAFERGYQQACDSILQHGVSYYRQLLIKYCDIKESQIDSVIKRFKFQAVSTPRTEDIKRARQWLDKQ